MSTFQHFARQGLTERFHASEATALMNKGSSKRRFAFDPPRETPLTDKKSSAGTDNARINATVVRSSRTVEKHLSYYFLGI